MPREGTSIATVARDMRAGGMVRRQAEGMIKPGGWVEGSLQENGLDIGLIFIFYSLLEEKYWSCQPYWQQMEHKDDINWSVPMSNAGKHLLRPHNIGDTEIAADCWDAHCGDVGSTVMMILCFQCTLSLLIFLGQWQYWHYCGGTHWSMICSNDLCWYDYDLWTPAETVLNHCLVTTLQLLKFHCCLEMVAADHTSTLSSPLAEDEWRLGITLMMAGPGSSPVMGQSGGPWNSLNIYHQDTSRIILWRPRWQ